MTLTLNVAVRENETRQQLKTEDMIPAVVYGPKQETLSLKIERGAFERTFKESGESTIIELQGLTEPIEVLVHQVDFYPTKGGFQHVDFYAIERGKDMTTEVPLVYTGEAPVEKTGGMVNQIMHEVTVTCRPSNLPKEILVDISGMTESDTQITVADLPVPEGVVVDNDPEEVVAVAHGARAEEVEEDTESVDMNAIEVEEKGKKEDSEVESE